MNLIYVTGSVVGAALNVYALIVFMDIFFSSSYPALQKKLFRHYVLYFVVVAGWTIFPRPLLGGLSNSWFYVLEISMFGAAVINILRHFAGPVSKKIGAILWCYVSYGFVTWISRLLTDLIAFRLVPGHDLGESSLVGLNFITANIIFVCLALLINRFKRTQKIDLHLPFSIIPLLLFQLITFVSLTDYLSAFFSHDYFSNIFGLLITLNLLGLNLMILYYLNSKSAFHEEKTKGLLLSQEKEFFHYQSQLMQQSVDDLSDFKHEINNHLIALKSLANAGRREEMDAYLDELVRRVGPKKLISSTGNLALDSLINYKLMNVSQEEVALDISLRIRSELKMSESDLAALFGELLDHALEALDHVNDKWLKLIVDYGQGCLFLKIENSFDGRLQQDSAFSNIRAIVDKYHGELNISHDSKRFYVSSTLYLSE